MSTYPGETPPPADDGPQDTPTDTEPTQPVGYWERQAAEQAREQEQQGHPSATTPYPQDQPPPQQNPYSEIPGVNPYGPYSPGAQQPPQPNQQYGQQYGQPYNQQPYQPQPYTQQPTGYPPQPGQPVPYPPPPGVPSYAGYAHAVPDHPQSTLSMVLGLVGIIGAFVLCGLPLVVSPFAWALGRNAVKEIEASQGRLGGLSQARAGMIMGIIGTIFLILAIVAVIGFIVIVAVADSTGTSTGSTV